jgi:DNA-binding beta-propeller fold protein YncE
MQGRNRVKRSGTVVGLLGAMLALAMVGNAFGAQTHVAIGSFGHGDLALAGHSGVGVSPSGADVYIADSESGHIDEFTAAGVLVRTFGAFQKPAFVAVDPSSGDVYVADREANSVSKFDGEGNSIASWGTGGSLTGPGGEASFGSVAGIAVNGDGHLYVVNEGRQIFRFAAGGAFEAQFETPFGVSAAGLAVDSTGDIYFVRGNELVAKITSSGGVVSEEVDPAPASDIAVDQVTDDLYIAHAHAVSQYSAAGHRFDFFGEESLRAAVGIGVGSDAIYVADASAGEVTAFRSALVPDVTAVAADDVGKNTATLHGSIGAAAGPPAACHFEYVDEAAFRTEGFSGAVAVPCVPGGPFTGSSVEPVEAQLTGISAGTAYRFRLVGSNENGANRSEALSFSTAPALGVETGLAAAVTPTTATLEGSIDPEGATVSECFFEFGEGAPAGNSIPCAESAAEIGTGSSPVAVHVDVSGLAPLTEYGFRLVAVNGLGRAEGSSHFFTTFGSPTVESAAVSEIESESALIAGSVNPNGEPTTASVQYVTEAEYLESGFANANEIPSGGEAIGGGEEPIAFSRQVVGLSPLTTYRFRIVATNPAGQAESADQVFTTFGIASMGLPDGRAYEQATPTDKNGNNISGGASLTQAARGGGAISFQTSAGLPGGEGAQQYPNYLAVRGDSGWSTVGLLPPAANGSNAIVLGWDEWLESAYAAQGRSTSSPLSLYELGTRDRELTQIAGGIVGSTESLNVTGTSKEGGAVAFESTEALTSEAAAGSPNLYLWNQGSGSVVLVGVLNEGGSPTGGSQAPPNDGLANRTYTQADHSLSEDASHAYFVAEGNRQLYLRLNPTRPQSPLDGGGRCVTAEDACTLEVSASQRSLPDPNGQAAAEFAGASTNGSIAYFLSRGALTDDATTGPEDEGMDLYRYDVGSETLSDLVPDAGDAAGAEVQGVLGTSSDGSYLYFAANGLLGDAEAKGAVRGDCERGTTVGGATGTCNLYLWHEGSVKFIAELDVTPAGNGGEPYASSDAMNWIAGPDHSRFTGRTARVSADGGTLLFRSQRSLTGYDNAGFAEFYRYSAAHGTLSCISCDPTGASPVGWASLQSLEPTAINVPEPAAFLTRNLSADGNRIFFESPDALVPADVNGRTACPLQTRDQVRACQDVYEWEAPTGSDPTDTCTSADPRYVPSAGGCIYLISTGTSPRPSYFADASESGADAFFYTAQPLVTQDKDELVDIYDARVNGGLRGQTESPASPCVSEAACRSAAAAPPAAMSPGSQGFVGPPNPNPTRHHLQKKKHGGKGKHRRRRGRGPHGRSHRHVTKKGGRS